MKIWRLAAGALMVTFLAMGSIAVAHAEGRAANIIVATTLPNSMEGSAPLNLPTTGSFNEFRVVMPRHTSFNTVCVNFWLSDPLGPQESVEVVVGDHMAVVQLINFTLEYQRQPKICLATRDWLDAFGADRVVPMTIKSDAGSVVGRVGVWVGNT